VELGEPLCEVDAAWESVPELEGVDDIDCVCDDESDWLGVPD
jgi:hypothetical protein